MNYLKTHRNFVLINKLLDLMLYLIIFTIVTTFSFMVYYTTKSFFILLLIMALIYVIGLFIAKLFEIKILLPSIVYIFVSLGLIVMISFYEKESINSDLLEFLLIVLTVLSFISLLITLYKYETPFAIYYKVKDYFSGVSFSKKIKTKFSKSKNHNTITPYSTHLIFEKNKLLNKLKEEYIASDNDLDNKYIKQAGKLENATGELNELKSQLDNVKRRLKIKHSGAQDYELCTQRKFLIKKITKKNKKATKFTVKVNTIKNNKTELKKIYEKNHYNISNSYNLRYINYTNIIKERLSSTKCNLVIIPFEDIEKSLEEVK